MSDISSVKCRIIPSSSELICSGDYASKVFQRYVSSWHSELLIAYYYLRVTPFTAFMCSLCVSMTRNNPASAALRSSLWWKTYWRTHYQPGTTLVSVPRHNLSFGSRGFRISALKIWNSLPPHIL